MKNETKRFDTIVEVISFTKKKINLENKHLIQLLFLKMIIKKEQNKKYKITINDEQREYFTAKPFPS